MYEYGGFEKNNKGMYDPVYRTDLKHYLNYESDTDIINFLYEITKLVGDGIKYRNAPALQNEEYIADSLKLLLIAQDFIRNKGLTEEFNEYCLKGEN